MKTLNLILSMLVALSIIGSEMFAQQDYSNEAVVYFARGVQRVAQTSQVTVSSSEILAVLQRHNVLAGDVIAAFPEFIEADTLKLTPNGRLIGQMNYAKVFKVRTAGVTVRNALIEDLNKLRDVLFAEPNATAKPLVIPNDQHFGRQWNMHNTGQYGGTTDADIDGAEAWDTFTGSSQRRIGIIDWGVDATHPDLSGKVTGDGPTISHGTHVAGIAAANTNNNSIGVAGVDWNAAIISKNIDGLDETGVNSKIRSAVDEGADVLNNSWGLYDQFGNPAYSRIVREPFAYAYKYDRVAAVAMGNDYGAVVNYPAAFGQGIIAVGATTIMDARTPYSTTANHIDVSAPGGYWDQTEHEIYSTVPGGGYDYMSGTSMATPHVSGIASLLKGYNSSLDNDDIENIVQLSADKVVGMQGQIWTNEYGYGRVNAKNALQRVGSGYTLTHSFVLGATDQGASSGYYMTIYGAQAVGLQDGSYWVQRHEVRQTVTYPNTPGVAVWGRGVVTNGWNTQDAFQNNFAMGFCEPVPGTVTSTGATLRTYVYELFQYPGGSFMGWYPTPPSNVRLEYTVQGVVSLSVSMSGPSVVEHPPKGTLNQYT